MPVALSYPGVYVEEIPSGVRTITGVSTSVTAFVGYTARGPLDEAVKVFNFGDFERIFGGLARDSEVSYAVQQFFLNGGSEAWVVRVADGSAIASAVLHAASGNATLKISAASAGAWGNLVHADVDYETTQPEATFNLTVTPYTLDASGAQVAGRAETFVNLSMNASSAQYAPSVVNAASQLVRLEDRHAAAGTGFSLSGDLNGLAGLDDAHRRLRLSVDGADPIEVEIFQPGQGAGLDRAHLADLATRIQSAVVGAGVAGFTCAPVGPLGAGPAGNHLKLSSPAAGASSAVQVLRASAEDAAPALLLGLANGGRERPGAADLRPVPGGNLSGDLSNLLAQPTPPIAGLSANTAQITAALRSGSTQIAITGPFDLSGPAMASLADLADRLQSKIRGFGAVNRAFATTVVKVVARQLRVVPGIDDDSANVALADVGTGTLTITLSLTGAGNYVNVKRYQLGTGKPFGALAAVTAGADGTPPVAPAPILGGLAAKTGIYALEDVDIFNLLCIPITSQFSDSDAASVVSSAMAYCLQKRAFYVVDPPKAAGPAEIKKFMQALTPDKNGALYFPMIEMPDPLDGYRLRAMAPSGTIAGLYARIDGNRGVWKAPAGTEATLVNVQGLSYNLTDLQCGELNKLGINCLRVFPVYGRVAWGGRTLLGADQQASEWKYIPVRRMALNIEESLFRGTQWVVFEPNDEPLWSQIRLNLGAFMQGLFRQGAFEGKTPKEAYFVKCDAETTTQDDIDHGVVNIVVGFRPLKPAEFVIIKLQQLAGQTA